MSNAEGKVIGVFYYKNVFGHILERQDRNSTSLTTISCGFPLKVVTNNNPKQGWSKVSSAGVSGFVISSYLSSSKPDCIQKNYPKFISALDLSLSEMFYWGRLYDMYINGKSKVK